MITRPRDLPKPLPDGLWEIESDDPWQWIDDNARSRPTTMPLAPLDANAAVVVLAMCHFYGDAPAQAGELKPTLRLVVAHTVQGLETLVAREDYVPKMYYLAPREVVRNHLPRSLDFDFPTDR